ncbi:TIGR02646 family protein [Aeromonas veronii]|nr:TIGR02646 family protein [Aeromonas veronii]
MKKLNRNLAKKPKCLDDMSHTKHTWKNMSSAKKRQVWVELDKFQDKICAYCESPAFRGEFTGHIEHFLDKDTHKDLTFDWDNLFGCCPSTEHCGHYKDQKTTSGDRRQFDSSLLIKPDSDDPEEYFQFLPSGKIKARGGIEEIKVKMALETIKALHLDAPSLELARFQQISRFQERLNVLIELIDCDDTEDIDAALLEYYNLQEESHTTTYRTAIKQAVTWLTD